MKAERIATVKLPAFRAAWRRIYGGDPSSNAELIGLSVALFETQAGDSWPGPDGVIGTQDDQRNWGATNLRGLRAHEQFLLGASAIQRIIDAGLPARGDRLWFNRYRYSWQILDGTECDVAAMQRDLGVTVDGRTGPKTLAALADQYPGADPAQYWPKLKQAIAINAQELSAIQSIMPTVGAGHEARAKEAMRVLLEGFGKENMPKGAIHCDSEPKNGAYFVFFAAFNDPGKTAAENEADGAEYYLRILVRTSAERAALESGNPFTMASAQYAASYFRGRHNPDEPGGDERNIEDYASGISRNMPSVRQAQVMAAA